ncbi:GLPGLI family protein [Flavobacterium jejuense]|uniref:GLPGLI family protein n=1 Tax=Flavobacterium jejuense TaxID=1544455 RepID=A0ABX0IW87_9FLAO|nr:GLPGLI family protein [Flavobacterium jejuense]NHN26336.1 GLPGLI family protein [Flavobacterium jejuense]
MKFLQTLFLFAPLLCLAQSVTIIEYDVQVGLLQRQGKLVVSSSYEYNYYFEVAKNENTNVEINETNNEKNINKVLGSKDEKRIQLYSKNRDTLYNVDYIDKENIVCYEIAKNISWEFSDETKVISNYTCNKATAFFRGRKYTAWFTTELPINQAPWKFNNLPGLVLQIHDDSTQFIWSVSKINFNLIIDSYSINRKLNKISLKEFITRSELENNKLSDQAMLKFTQRGAKIIKSEHIRGRELKFEWEE